MRCFLHTKTFHRKKIFIVFGLSLVMLIGLAGRLVWLMVFEADYYQQLATDLHERERSIKAAREGFWIGTGKCLRITGLCVRSP